jgi:hypothetical protein
MKTVVAFLLLLITTLSVGCAQNLWWDAERSGWVLFGTDVQVPREAEALPLNMLPEASNWNQSVYVEAWIESIDQEAGAWMTISDGTSSPVLVFFDQGFNVPRNARGRRTMAWGRPMVASGTTTNDQGTSRTNVTLEFTAKAVLIQGFYGLEAAPRRRETPSEEPMSLPATTPTETIEVDLAPEDELLLELPESDDMAPQGSAATPGGSE